MASPMPRSAAPRIGSIPAPPLHGTLGPGPFNPQTAQGMIGPQDFVSDKGTLTAAGYRFLESVFVALLKSGGGPMTLVSRLPPPAGYVGIRTFVSDALAPTFGSPVAGGGAVPVPVYCDGTAWRVG